MTTDPSSGTEPPDPDDEIAAYVARLYRKYKNRVAWILRQDTGLNGPSLEDHVSSVFSKIQTSLRNGSVIEYEKGYVDQATRSVAKDYFGKKQSTPDPVEGPEEDELLPTSESSFSEDPHTSMEQRLLQDEVEQALAEMETHFNEKEWALGTLMRIMVVTLHYHLDPNADTELVRRLKQEENRTIKLPDFANEYELDLKIARKHYYAARQWLKRRLANGDEERNQ